MAQRPHPSPPGAAEPPPARPWYRRGVVWRRLVLLLLVIALIGPARPRLAGIPRWRARLALADRQPEAALRWLDRADRVSAGSGETEFLRARAFRKLGRLDKTRASLIRATKLGFPVKRLEREQWLALAQAGQMRDAEPHLPALLTDPGGDAQEICEAYVTGFIRNHRVESAASLLETWAGDYPYDPLPPLIKGKLLIELSQWQEAEAALRKSLEIRPDDGEALYYLGNVLVERRKLPEALEVYDRAAAAPGAADRRRAGLGKVRCLRMLGRAEEGRPLLAEILRAEPDQPDALIELARVESEAGNYADAVAALEKADAKSSGDIEVRNAWAAALRGAGRLDEAKEQYDRIGRAQAALGKTPNLLARILKRPDDVEARFEAGRIFLEHGDPAKGVVWLQSVLNYDPRHEPTCRLLAEYYEGKAAADPRFAELARDYRRRLETPSAPESVSLGGPGDG